jgi:endonuclease G, mitochondrial
MIKLSWLLLLLPICSLAQNFRELASAPHDQEIIERDHYALSYNEQHEVANWVAYDLHPKKLQNCVARTNAFRSDPLVTTGSAELQDYRHSGYDRGHLLPAGDMKFDAQAMRETFYLSNVTPQSPAFNRGRWAQLELLVRAWAKSYGKLWIVTGPVLREKLPSIGINQVSVPHYHYKVLLRKDGKSFKGIGFLMAQTVPYRELQAYALSIRSIEAMTNIDFFHFLHPAEADRVEKDLDLEQWDFQAAFSYLPCQA